MNRLVSINVAINDAIGDMAMEEQRLRPLFMRWAERAERKIGSFYALKRKYFTLQLSDDCHRAHLPCGVESIMGVMYGDVSDCNCDAVFRNAYNYKHSAPYWGVFPDGQYAATDFRQWEIQDDSIVFLYPLTGITEITIDAAYREMDQQGFIMVPDEHLEAISAFIEYKKAKRSRWGLASERMAEYQIQQMYRDWGRLMKNARASSSEPSPSEYAEIVAMINNPLSGWGGGQFRYPDEFTLSWWGGRF